MSEPTFRVVFDGQVTEGFSIGMVKKNLAQLFNADADRIATIFSGQTVVLKRNIDEQMARKYQAALLKAGAVTTIRQDDDSAAGSVEPAKETPNRQASTANPDGTEQPDDWSLAPSGSMLLRDNERHKHQELDIDLSHISLASTFLSFEAEPSSSTAAAPDTSHISIAEVGATLGDQSQTQEVTPVSDLDASLAPVGADLSDTKPAAEPSNIDISHLSLE